MSLFFSDFIAMFNPERSIWRDPFRTGFLVIYNLVDIHRKCFINPRLPSGVTSMARVAGKRLIQFNSRSLSKRAFPKAPPK